MSKYNENERSYPINFCQGESSNGETK
ncbi:hypothetical protein B566_EDAN009474 [Ephemera danica]|nr:hypothetical protein B566_EDAN009474 [Ephemera danica]